MNTDNCTQIEPEKENLNTLQSLIALVDSGNLPANFCPFDQ